MHHATLRFNVDETLVVPDAVVIDSLRKVHIWHHLSSHVEGGEEQCRALLDKNLSALPVLSVGQTQLLSLARAIIKKWTLSSSATEDGRLSGTKPVLLLDEATSSLDPVTEGIIHDVIETEFSDQGHTIIMVTHRPSMLAGRMRESRDFFVVMSNGCIDEVKGAPAGKVRRNLVRI